jgi:hypothetical protein
MGYPIKLLVNRTGLTLRHVTQMISIILTTAFFTLCQTSSDDSKLALAKRLDAWNSFCGTLNSGHSWPVLMDIPADLEPPVENVNSKNLKKFLLIFQRNVEYTQNSACFVRDPSSENSILDPGKPWLKELSKLDRATLERMFKDGIDASELPDDAQKAFYRVASFGEKGMQSLMEADDVRVHLYQSPTVYFDSPSDGSKQSSGLGAIDQRKVAQRIKIGNSKVVTATGSQQARKLRLFAAAPVPPSRLDFDFSRGEVINVEDLNFRLTRFKNCPLTFDSRFAKQPLYIRGKFGAQDLSDQLAKILKAKVPRAVLYEGDASKRDFEQLMKAARDNFDPNDFFGLEGLSSSELEVGTEVGMNDLLKRSSYLNRGIGKKFQFDQSAKGRIGMKLGMAIGATGKTRVSLSASSFLFSP